MPVKVSSSTELAFHGEAMPNPGCPSCLRSASHKTHKSLRNSLKNETHVGSSKVSWRNSSLSKKMHHEANLTQVFSVAVCIPSACIVFIPIYEYSRSNYWNSWEGIATPRHKDQCETQVAKPPKHKLQSHQLHREVKQSSSLALIQPHL
jgi:hypothetical protein